MPEVDAMKPGARLISYVAPAREKEVVEALAAKRMTVIGACARCVVAWRSLLGPVHGAWGLCMGSRRAPRSVWQGCGF